MNKIFEQFKNVVVYDYEFKFTPGNPPEPVCVVYKELHSQQITKHWLVGEDKVPPVVVISPSPNPITISDQLKVMVAVSLATSEFALV